MARLLLKKKMKLENLKVKLLTVQLLLIKKAPLIKQKPKRQPQEQN